MSGAFLYSASGGYRHLFLATPLDAEPQFEFFLNGILTLSCRRDRVQNGLD